MSSNSSPRSSRRRNVSDQRSVAKPLPPTVQEPAKNPDPKPTQREPSMFQRVAETAAGVAIGSTIGNVISNSISSLFGSSKSASTTETKTASELENATSSTNVTEKSNYTEKSEDRNVCEKLVQNFLKCLEEGDLTKCEDLKKEYKDCQSKYFP